MRKKCNSPLPAQGKKCWILLLLLLSLSFSVELFAQAGLRVAGTVSDNKGVPIAGANVTVKGQTFGTTTDASGRFVLEVPSRESILLISVIGYLSKEETVG